MTPRPGGRAVRGGDCTCAPRGEEARPDPGDRARAGVFIESAGEYLEFKNRFFKNEPNVLMNCDIGHLFCVGDDPADVIRANAEQIAHVHVEDIGKNRVHQHLTPGKGRDRFLRRSSTRLRDIEYYGLGNGGVVSVRNDGGGRGGVGVQTSFADRRALRK